MSANDFYLDVTDIPELTKADIIARADAQAWKSSTEELVSISRVEYDIKAQKGRYPVSFHTAAGTMITVDMIVDDENKVEASNETIYAVNIYKTIDDIKESIALETDLKTWANAQAWTNDGEEHVAITDVEYSFSHDTIETGKYKITFKTQGYEYKIDTTDKHEVGERVGLDFTPDDLHIMHKEGGGQA